MVIHKNRQAAQCMLLFVASFLFCCGLLIVPAFAASGDIAQSIGSGIEKIYSIITSIVLPIGALALAVCALGMFMGGARSADNFKSKAVTIVIALLVVYAAPLIINEAASWFKDMSYGAGSGFWNGIVQ